MIPLWLAIVAAISTLVIGFVGGLAWQGRPHRNAHSFHDPALSVTATIERATSSPAEDDTTSDEDPDHEDTQHDTEPENADDPHEDKPTNGGHSPLEINGEVVRYYFARQQDRETADQHGYDPDRTVRLPPARMPQQQPIPPPPLRTATRNRPYVEHAAGRHAVRTHR